jgi:integrase-like protein
VQVIVARCENRPQLFVAVLDGRLICRSRQPLFDGARVLLEAGYLHPDTVVEIWPAGASGWAMRARLGKVAGLTVVETGPTETARCWNGAPIASVKTALKTAVRLAKLPGKFTPHTFRHTAATWLMQNGVSLWRAAGFLGMSVETLDRVYGHHHPDYLSDAAEGIARKPNQNQALVVPLAGAGERRKKLK